MANIRGNKLRDPLADILGEVEPQNLSDALADVNDNNLIDALADTLAEVKAKTLSNAA